MEKGQAEEIWANAAWSMSSVRASLSPYSYATWLWLVIGKDD